jgi:transcription-repair coupling factor (superfamily II helicase)
VLKTKSRLDKLADKLAASKVVTVSGVTANAKAPLLADLVNPLHKQKRAVFWFVAKKDFSRIFAQLKYWLPQDIELNDFSANGPALIVQAMSAKNSLNLVPDIALEKYFPSPEEYRNQCLQITLANSYSLPELLGHLQNTGYEQADTAAEPGYYARRGGLVEIFPPATDYPIRLELAGDKIELLEKFNPRTKKSLGKKTQVSIPPYQLAEGRSSIRQALAANSNALIVRDENIEFPKYPGRQLIFLAVARGDIGFDWLPATSYYGNLRLLKADLEKIRSDGYQISIHTNKQAQLATVLGDLPVNYRPAAAVMPLGYINALDKEILLSSYEIFGPPEPETERAPANEVFLASLKPGDFVVHTDHGVGKFIGLRRHLVDEGMREYYVLEYAEGDRLSVPVEYADKIDRYIGRANPKIHRLHGANWQQVKMKIKKATREIAGDLLRLYAARQAAAGYRYLPDTAEQIELERSFKYEDTPGQRRATEEIKRDLEREKPMDRLLVGDVGYGKTEVSIRAAFKAVQTGKQVALLCPTTVLAEQHFQTYQKRLQNFPVTVAALSRFRTATEQKQIIEKLAAGKINIIIGTHRLLSADIVFKDLGLIIIDEEQRFGVTHKEKLKKLRNNVDVLAMSATPIPRTLHFSLAGLRDISTIDTPPPGRQTIDTIIAPYNDKKIAAAIRRELARRGQIYFLHNRVETIDTFAKHLHQLVPAAKIGIAHGQLPEKKLSSIMNDFYHRRYDILVCSTIIESGLDIANVNTLIVDEATKFGLSQLYQLRGRIGRGAVKAYAHLFYQSKKLKGRAKERLEALLAARELGAGFKIAMRDLEIRGTGNLFGREQHGSINAIGLSLYSRLLHQAVMEAKTGRELPPQLDVAIDLPVDAFIPADFFATTERKLRTYKELADVKDQSELNNVVARLIANSRYCYSRKDLPPEIVNLISIMELKLLAQTARVMSIDTVLKKTAADTKQRLLKLTFAEVLEDNEFYNFFVKKNPAWERKDEQTVRIAVKRLGDNWITNLKNTIRAIKKHQV